MSTIRDVGRRADVSAVPASRAVEGAGHARGEAKARGEAPIDRPARGDEPKEAQDMSGRSVVGPSTRQVALDPTTRS